MLKPFERNDGGVWIQVASVLVKASACSVIERAETLAQSQTLRHADMRATWAKEAELRDRADGEIGRSRER